jgi:hypothetical protein
MRNERRFNLVDGMIFVAATAVGRTVAKARMTGLPTIPPPVSWSQSLARAIITGLQASLPMLLTATLAVLAIRLRRPRPTLLRLGREPGFAASVVAAPAILLCVVSAIPLLWNRHGSFFQGLSLLAYTPEGGFAVTGAWLALAVGKRWRPQPNWVDRLGRLVGVGWIGANAIHWLGLVLIEL